MDFSPSPRVEELSARIGEFLDEHVYPVELEALQALDAEVGPGKPYPDILVDIRERAKREGLWNLFLPDEEHGTGLTNWEYGMLCEAMGRSLVAPMAFNCSAPDTGNIEILVDHGTPEQKDRWLQPLLDGEIRSCFSMTEPETSGSDPTGLRGTAVLDGDEWVIDAHKWFSSGADGAAFGVVMLVTEPDAEPHKRASMILVPTDTPGYELVRKIPVMGHEGRGWGTHCETRFTDVRVPLENVLGEPGDGFRIAQKRLGPGRIHHVMRWLGQMQRAFDLMCAYSLERKTFGETLASKQTIQNWIAESAAEIQACRLMTMQAAQRIDEGDEARVEVSLIKFYAAKALGDVIDRALQVHGGLGMTEDTPLASMWRAARAGRIYDGPDEVHKMVVARRILRSYEEGGTWRFT